MYARMSAERKGEEVFPNELVEAVPFKKLIVNGPPQVGTKVSMQYKNDLWMGKILSVHGKLSLTIQLSE